MKLAEIVLVSPGAKVPVTSDGVHSIAGLASAAVVNRAINSEKKPDQAFRFAWVLFALLSASELLVK